MFDAMNQKMSDRISPETETIVAVATPPGEGGIGMPKGITRLIWQAWRQEERKRAEVQRLHEL